MPHRHDGPCRLVTEDDRLAHADRAEAAILIVVQVGAADAAGTDRHQHLSAPRIADFVGLDAEIALIVEAADACVHKRA